MLQFLKTRWELLVVLVIFIAVKLPALHYPFYWDESWSYAPGVKLMYLHGPSLMPNAIDLFYSRGHPLLFYATAAAWMRIFGDSHIAQHSFCLFISLLTIICVYEFSLSLFGKRAAIICLIFLPLQIIFYVQSTLLLPEVMVGLLILLTLYFYSKEKYLLTFLFCSGLLLTKESGMVLGLILGIHATGNLLNKRLSLNSRVKTFFSILLPGVVSCSFYLLQKKLNGWYFFPQHTGLIEWDWNRFWDKFTYSMDILFGLEYKFRIFELLLLLSVIVAIRLKNMRHAIPLIPAYLIYASIDNKINWMPRKVLFVLIIISLLITAYQLVNLAINKTLTQKKFTYLSVIFLVGYLSFSCINFYTARYLICSLVVVVILSAAWFSIIISHIPKIIFYITLSFIIVVSLYGFYKDEGIGDISLGMFDAMGVEQNVVDYFEKENFYDKIISEGSFQNREHFTKPYTGFLHGNDTFKHVSWDINANTDFVIFDNIEPDGRYDAVKKDSAYRLRYRTVKGQAWTEVYESKK